MPATEAAFDLAIIGGGIVGAAIAYWLAPQRRVLLLEAESAHGYHATGRSAALYTDTYGPPAVRALTRDSRAFFDAPPAGFAAVPLLKARGTLLVGSEVQRALVLALHQELRAEGTQAELLDGPAARGLVPVLRPGAAALAVWSPASFDIDVDALLQGFLRGARAAGAACVTGARVVSLTRAGDAWEIRCEDGRAFRAPLLVNAAGAWADTVAGLAGVGALGVHPRRRSAFLFAPPEGLVVEHWPAVIAIDESWYFKPDAGLLLGSPANADPVPPHDVMPEELDIASGIARIEEATTLSIRRPRSTWAGLRSFVDDGEPVCGFDARLPGFFWAAALGGYGIQSAPGFGRLCAEVLCGRATPPAALAPSRVTGPQACQTP